MRPAGMRLLCIVPTGTPKKTQNSLILCQERVCGGITETDGLGTRVTTMRHVMAAVIPPLRKYLKRWHTLYVRVIFL